MRIQEGKTFFFFEKLTWNLILFLFLSLMAVLLGCCTKIFCHLLTVISLMPSRKSTHFLTAAPAQSVSATSRRFKTILSLKSTDSVKKTDMQKQSTQSPKYEGDNATILFQKYKKKNSQKLYNELLMSDPNYFQQNDVFTNVMLDLFWIDLFGKGNRNTLKPQKKRKEEKIVNRLTIRERRQSFSYSKPKQWKQNRKKQAFAFKTLWIEVCTVCVNAQTWVSRIQQVFLQPEPDPNPWGILWIRPVWARCWLLFSNFRKCFIRATGLRHEKRIGS